MTTFPTFGEFFGAINGDRTPYLWQMQAAERLYAGEPIDAVAVPTGLGKTQIVTAWLWAFARQRHELAAGLRDRRTVATRLHFLVDRRVVVDDVHDTALRMKAAVEAATDGALLTVARALDATSHQTTDGTTTSQRSLVDVVALRGGLPVRPEHTSSPFTPTIAVGTLDLVVSRLLWRGYGIAPGRRPIDAALVGADSLIVLDEAHIAEQSLQTLRVLTRNRDHFETSPLPRPALTVMSATLRPGPALTAITFDEAAEVAQHPDLLARLLNRQATAIDVTWLTYPTSPGKAPTAAVRKQAVDELVAEMADQVAGRLAGPGTATVAFVNTVEHAHKLGAELEDRIGTSTKVVVLHGGMPVPVSRRRLEAVRPFHNGSPAAARAAAPQTVVVATQTLEVGADLDFDAAVIECPSADALVQRIGRVNRAGKRTGATVHVVARHDDPAPVYGTAVIEATGTMAEGTATVGALDKVVAAGLPSATVRAAGLVLTIDRPTFDDYTFTRGLSGQPDVGTWIRSKDADFRVQVVWREALNVLPEQAHERYANELPARGWETWSVRPDTLAAALRTMNAEKNQSCSVLVVQPNNAGDRVLGFTGRAGYDTLGAALTPGSTVYVATGLGALPDFEDTGVDLSGFRLTGEEPVVIALAGRSSKTPGVVSVAVDPDDALPASEMSELVQAAIRAASSTPPTTSTSPLAIEAAAALIDQVTHVGLVDGIVVTPVVSGEVWFATPTRARAQSAAPLDLGLDGHLRDVGDRAADWGQTVGMDTAVVAALRLAGQRHDLGKLLPQFQKSLRYELVGRDLVLHPGVEGVRAKSTLPRWRWADANRLARVLDGFRHEALSVTVSDKLGYPDGVDPTLVRHLIGAHHGHGRGMFQVYPEAGQASDYEIGGQSVSAANALQADLSDEWATQFHDLNVTYGAYGLALMEAVLRLADWSVSSENVSPT
ncbi:type I-G CRISPR-associated helicase/endonuclease Cas3g [Pengzhenrongella sp.]|uniref:type I-G CRISPR-associated helicase/endonuclease Cas3g n=1 Tax=Pengzhenrongella sp. TaxID=2888820 RepID=UPI002F920EE4